VAEHDLFIEAEQERIKQFEARANINDTESLLNMGRSPKTDLFKKRI
jgi:hypothetical protein